MDGQSGRTEDGAGADVGGSNSAGSPVILLAPFPQPPPRRAEAGGANSKQIRKAEMGKTGRKTAGEIRKCAFPLFYFRVFLG
jgi:hypothetical protein